MINVIQLVAVAGDAEVRMQSRRRKKKQREVKLHDVRIFTAFPFVKQHVTQFNKCIFAQCKLIDGDHETLIKHFFSFFS